MQNIQRFNRRSILTVCATSLFLSAQSRTFAAQNFPLADAHSHLGFVNRTLRQAELINQAKESGLSLISWCIVPDAPWLKQTASGIIQSGSPGRGQIASQFTERLTRVKEYLSDNSIQAAFKKSDIDAALSGQLRVVLASEGADFTEGDIVKLTEAYQLGLRHTQLVHYIESSLGDLQTIAPKNGGLTQFGQSVIKECNELGILVDLAHCDASTVEVALETSSKPMIWSHGWYANTQGKHNDPHGVLSRRMSWTLAKKIADKGGVLGLWSLGVTDRSLQQYPEHQYPISVDPSRRMITYASGIAKMVKELGADHVCFGTDMEGVGPAGVINYYRELRKVTDLLSDQGLSDSEIMKVCIGNYARVLKDSMSS